MSFTASHHFSQFLLSIWPIFCSVIDSTVFACVVVFCFKNTVFSVFHVILVSLNLFHKVLKLWYPCPYWTTLVVELCQIFALAASDGPIRLCGFSLKACFRSTMVMQIVESSVMSCQQFTSVFLSENAEKTWTDIAFLCWNVEFLDVSEFVIIL